MKAPSSILVILDKPKHEQTALDEACRLMAARPATHLRLVSFVWLAMAEQKEVFDAHQRRALKKEIIRTRESWLRNLVLDRKLAGASISIEVVWTSDIAAWVVAECGASDLVLKSVHKTKTLLHTPLDWALIRSCPAPLLLVGSRPARRRQKTAANDVIATVDLRNTDRTHQMLNLKVLDAAARFADIRGGKLHCVAVIEFSEVLSDLEMIDSRKVRREAMAATQDFLNAMLAPYHIPKNRVHRPAGKVGHMVAASARKTGAGLVVVGSAARRGIGARMLGNSAEKILERSPVDLLVVHP
ncbi:MAG: universal stress protein [Pseudomonadales bacterium]